MKPLLSAATSVALAAALSWLAGASDSAWAAVRISVSSSAFAGDRLDVQWLADSVPGVVIGLMARQATRALSRPADPIADPDHLVSET